MLLRILSGLSLISSLLSVLTRIVNCLANICTGKTGRGSEYVRNRALLHPPAAPRLLP